MQAFSLSGETALITGGGTGLGSAIAQCFVALGAKVVIVGRREDVLKDTVERLGEQATYYTYDITDFDQTPAFIERVTSEVGQISILINNAGVHLKKPVTETTVEGFQSVLDTHLLGAFALSKAVIPAMQAAGHGNIVFMASMTSLMGMPLVVAYSAAKAAYSGVVRSLATELAQDGIRVNAVAPGFIDTPMLHQALDQDLPRKNRILNRTPMGRFGDPEDIGWAVSYLCSPAAKFITGQILAVDGGMSIAF